MSLSMARKGFSKYMTGVWPECVEQVRAELIAKGYTHIRIVNSWKHGRKDIYIKKE